MGANRVGYGGTESHFRKRGKRGGRGGGNNTPCKPRPSYCSCPIPMQARCPPNPPPPARVRVLMRCHRERSGSQAGAHGMPLLGTHSGAAGRHRKHSQIPGNRDIFAPQTPRLNLPAGVPADGCRHPIVRCPSARGKIQCVTPSPGGWLQRNRRRLQADADTW